MIHLDLCFWSPDECKSNIHSSFGSVFGLHQLLREVSGSLAAKCSTLFTSSSLNLSAGQVASAGWKQC